MWPVPEMAAWIDRQQGMEALPLRLSPRADLRQALEQALAPRGRRAGFVVAGIGSLSSARIRLAGARLPTELDGDLEILTLAGTVADNGSHLHISIADADGRVTGGHVAPGCTVRTTAEVLLLLLTEWSFHRQRDPSTGFEELMPSRAIQDGG